MSEEIDYDALADAADRARKRDKENPPDDHTREPMLAQVRQAIRTLPLEHLEELAKGPLKDKDDCRICEFYDQEKYGYGRPGLGWAKRNAIAVLLDWHMFYADGGYGDRAYRRCLCIYRLAACHLKFLKRRLQEELDRDHASGSVH